MKNSLFLLGAAAVVALSSCTKNEVLEVAENRAIGFDAFVGKSTRVTEDVTLANLDSFELYGWRGNDLIFNKQNVSVEKNGTCTYSPTQYWEGGYTYAFEAVAPKNGENGVAITPAKEGGTINFTSNGITDLIYAKATDVPMNEKIESAPDNVGLTFKHLLSRVKFTFANNFPANAAAKIAVSKVTITNANTVASITPATGAWTGQGTPASITFPGTIDNVAAQNSDATEHMYLIPVDAPNYTLTFTVTLTQAKGVTSTYEHSTTINTKLEKGNSYNFTATLTPQNIDPETQMYPIEFKATETPWTDFGDETVAVPSVPQP